MEIDKSIGVLIGGLALCGAACVLAPSAPVVGAATLAAVAGGAVAGAGQSLAPNIAADIFSRFADWTKGKLHDKGAAAKNHDLRELMVMSIENVLHDVIKTKPGGTDGVKLLKAYKARVRERQKTAAVDDRFKGTWEETVPHYFKPRIAEFSSVKALTPAIWKHFLNEVSYDTLSADEQAALDVATNALYEFLPKHIVGVYRDALQHHPTIYVAVQTSLLQETWACLTHIDQKADALRHQQSGVIAQLTSIAEAIKSAHPTEFENGVAEFRVLLWTIDRTTRETFAVVNRVDATGNRVEETVGRVESALVRIHTPHLASHLGSQQQEFEEWYLAAQEQPRLYKGRAASGIVHMRRFGYPGKIYSADVKGGVLPPGLSHLLVPGVGSRVCHYLLNVRELRTVIGFASPEVSRELDARGQHGIWEALLHYLGWWKMPGDPEYRYFAPGCPTRVVGTIVGKAHFVRNFTEQEMAEQERDEFDPT